MADKNKNGIPDDKENGGKPKNKYGPGQKVQPMVGSFSGEKRTRAGVNPYFDQLERGNVNYGLAKPGERSPLQAILGGGVDVLRQGANFFGDMGNFTQDSPSDRYGTGLGDSIFGVRKGYYDSRQPAVKGGLRGLFKNSPAGTTPPQQEDPAMSLADYLRMASELIGGGGGVNYDPQRSTARQNATENDARLEAMYRQLRGSIDADAPVLRGAYQEAIDSTQANSQNAQSQAQAATDSANARNNEVLANLGIQEASGNIIQNGTDLNTQTAQRISDMAARGQAAGDRLVSNQETALTHNTNIGNAAGLEGNLQRAQNQARLQALLSEIDMAEQQQNASLSQNRLSSQMGMAQELLNFDRYNQEREDNLQMSAAELAAKGQNSLPDLGSFLKALGIDPADVAKDPSQYGSLLSSLTKYSVTP